MIKKINKLSIPAIVHKGVWSMQVIVLTMCGLFTWGEARRYEPRLPNNLLGYVQVRDFKAKLTAHVKEVSPNGTILLDIQLQAERASEMKVSLEPKFAYTEWKEYVPVIRNWRVTPRSKLITLYAVFKRKNNAPSLGSSISPIVHYTLDLNNVARVLERTIHGYMDWTAHELVVEEIEYPVLEESEKSFKLSETERRTKTKLELSALRSLEDVRVMSGFTIADLLYLEPTRREQLIHYLSLLALEDINYGRGIRDGRPVLGVEGLGQTNNLSPRLRTPLQTAVLHESINLFNPIPPSVRLIATLPLLKNPKILSENGRTLISYPTLYEQVKPRSVNPDVLDYRDTQSIQTYQGLVLDLRGTDYEPNLYPRVVTRTGQAVLTSDLYAKTQNIQTHKQAILTEAIAYVSQSSSHVAYVQYVRNLATTDFPAETLFIRAREISEPLQDIVLEDFHGTLLLSSSELREQIVNGAFWIVVD